ncbi:putative ribonuclease H-like domain-containing protein [Tanacetum coccineum]
MRPFGCHVTILNTLDYLGKFDGKSDEGFFIGYSMNSKAFRVYNIRTRKVEENLHIRFLEDKPIIAGDGPKWLFDINVLTKSINYVPVVAGTNSNDSVGTEESIGKGHSRKETRSSQDYILMPMWKDGSLFDSSLKNASNDEPQPSSDAGKKDDEGVNKESRIDGQERPKNITIALLEATHADFFGDETKIDMSNITTTYLVPSTPNTRIHKDHSLDHVIDDMQSGVLARRMTKTTNEQGFISAVYEGKTHEELHTCLIMPPKQMSQGAIAKLVADEVAKALAADHATGNTSGAGGSGNAGGGLIHDIAAYTNRFNELVLLCPDVVPSTKKKISQYIKGLPSYIQGETYSSKPTTLNEAIRMAHGLMEHKVQGWKEKNADQNKRKWEGGNQGNNQGNRNNNRGDYRDNRRHNQNNNRRNGGARAMTQAQGENVNQGGHEKNSPPKCNRVTCFHLEIGRMKFIKCGKRGHHVRDCRGKGVATGANAEPIRVCFKCGDSNHLANSEVCPEKKKHREGNASAMFIYAVKDVDSKAQGPI